MGCLYHAIRSHSAHPRMLYCGAQDVGKTKSLRLNTASTRLIIAPRNVKFCEATEFNRFSSHSDYKVITSVTNCCGASKLSGRVEVNPS